MVEGNIDAVKTLLEQGVDINSGNEIYQTPLDGAAAAGEVDVVRLLVERGAEVNSRDKLGWTRFRTPLHDAALCGHLKVVKL